DLAARHCTGLHRSSLVPWHRTGAGRFDFARGLIANGRGAGKAKLQTWRQGEKETRRKGDKENGRKLILSLSRCLLVSESGLRGRLCLRGCSARENQDKARRAVGRPREGHVAAVLAGQAPGGRQTEAAATPCGAAGEKRVKEVLAFHGCWAQPIVFDHDL